MKRFLLGVAVVAGAIYAASKLVEDDTKEELCGNLNRAAEDAKDKIRAGIGAGKGKAMRVRVKARQEVRAGKKKVSKMTGDLADKLTNDLHNIEDKLKEKKSKITS